MAKCEKRELKPEPPPVEYVLTLTADEARSLAYLLANHTPLWTIYDVLADAGVFKQ